MNLPEGWVFMISGAGKHALDDLWESLKVPVAGNLFAQGWATLSQVDWTQFVVFLGVSLTALGSSLIGLWRYFMLSRIEIEIRQRQAITTAVDKLDADRIETAARRSAPLDSRVGPDRLNAGDTTRPTKV